MKKNTLHKDWTKICWDFNLAANDITITNVWRKNFAWGFVTLSEWKMFPGSTTVVFSFGNKNDLSHTGCIALSVEDAKKYYDENMAYYLLNGRFPEYTSKPNLMTKADLTPQEQNKLKRVCRDLRLDANATFSSQSRNNNYLLELARKYEVSTQIISDLGYKLAGFKH